MAVKLWKSGHVLRKCHLFAQCNACWNLILRRSTCWEDKNFCLFYSAVNKIFYWRPQETTGITSALLLHLSWSPKADFQRLFLLLLVASLNETCIAECQCCVSWEKTHQICPMGYFLWFSDMFLWCVCHEAGLCSPVKECWMLLSSCLHRCFWGGDVSVI